MKKLCILTLLFFIALPVFNVFAACDELNDAMDAAAEAVSKAQKEVKSLRNQNRAKWAIAIAKSLGAGEDAGEADPADLGDKMLDQFDHNAVKNKLKAAEQALEIANQAYSDAYTAYMLCMVSHLQEEIEGPCGHTYQRLNRAYHAEVVGMCGHTYYYCLPSNHNIISIYPCKKCGSYYFVCQSDNCMAGGSHQYQ